MEIMLRKFNLSKRRAVKSKDDSDHENIKTNNLPDTNNINSHQVDKSPQIGVVMRNGVSASASCKNGDILRCRQRNSYTGGEQQANGNQNKSNRLSLVGWSLKKLRAGKPNKKDEDDLGSASEAPAHNEVKPTIELDLNQTPTTENLCSTAPAVDIETQNDTEEPADTRNDTVILDDNSHLLITVTSASTSKNSILNEAYSVEVFRRRCSLHRSNDLDDVESCQDCEALKEHLEASFDQESSDNSSVTMSGAAQDAANQESNSELVHDYLPCDSSDTDNGSEERWSLTKELVKLSTYGWYWGPITREEAEEKIADQPDGSFLVRDSTDERYLFSLSFRSSGRTLHTRIEYWNGEFSFYIQPRSESYRSIAELIGNSMTDSMSGTFCYSRSSIPGAPSFAVKLTRPVSRFTQVRSLQYLCRFVIRQHTRVDHIQSLPLPGSVKGWLKESQY